MSDSFPVFFHIGQDLNLKTKAFKGRLVVSPSSIHLIDQSSQFSFSTEQMKSVALTRPHAVGSVIKVDLGRETLFLAITRFMIGQFALINYSATVRLFNALSEMVDGPASSEFPPPRRLSWKRHLGIFLIFTLIGFSCVALLSFL